MFACLVDQIHMWPAVFINGMRPPTCGDGMDVVPEENRRKREGNFKMTSNFIYFLVVVLACLLSCAELQPELHVGSPFSKLFLIIRDMSVGACCVALFQSSGKCFCLTFSLRFLFPPPQNCQNWGLCSPFGNPLDWPGTVLPEMSKHLHPALSPFSLFPSFQHIPRIWVITLNSQTWVLHPVSCHWTTWADL